MMKQSNLGLSRIGQIAVSVKNLEKAKRFYQEALGIPFLFDAPGMAFFQCGDTRLMLGVPEKPEFDPPSSILYFRVDDINEAHTTLRGRGVEFVEEPRLVHRAPDHELWLAFFRDIDGNTLALMSEVRSG